MLSVENTSQASVRDWGCYYHLLRVLFLDDLLTPKPRGSKWRALARYFCGAWTWLVATAFMIAQRHLRFPNRSTGTDAGELISYSVGLTCCTQFIMVVVHVYQYYTARPMVLIGSDLGAETLQGVGSFTAGFSLCLCFLIAIPGLMAVPDDIIACLLIYLSLIFIALPGIVWFVSFPFAQSLIFRHRFYLLVHQFVRIFEPGRTEYRKMREELLEVVEARKMFRRVVDEMMRRTLPVVIPAKVVFVLGMLALGLEVLRPDPYIYPDGTAGLRLWISLIGAMGVGVVCSALVLSLAVPSPLLLFRLAAEAKDTIPPLIPHYSPNFDKDLEYDKELLRKEVKYFFVDCMVNPVVVTFYGWQITTKRVQVAACVMAAAIVCVYIAADSEVWIDDYCNPKWLEATRLGTANHTCSNL